MRIFNTLTRKLEPLPHKKHLGFYSCGPTVYDFAHIGNFRAYIFADILKRYLQYKGYQVKHIMNITDVDDKTIKNSVAQGMSLQAFTEKYTRHFMEDLETLNIRKADAYPKATETIPEMIALIETLIEKGYAYKAQDGIYFAIEKFKSYGELAHLERAELKAGASERVASDEYDKQSANDFALWKFYSPKDGDVVWETPFGRGRPGWHIECSAMATKYLGETFDIHSGGIDLIFPHHQNEIAQSEAASGKTFVHQWMHNEHLIVDGKKMSKSLGNFYTLRDVLKKGHSAKSVRFLLLSVHYRAQLNFTFDSLKASQAVVDRLNDLYARLMDAAKKQGKETQAVQMALEAARKGFEKGMDDDLNISEGLAAINELMTVLNTLEPHGEDAKAAIALLDELDGVLGLIAYAQDDLEPELQALIERREAARKAKDWALSDTLRDELRSKGIQVDDAKDGIRWKRIRKL